MSGVLRNVILENIRQNYSKYRLLHTTTVCCKAQSGRYRPTKKGDFPLTYEMAYPPHEIAHKKSWNSWNTTNLEGGLRPSETAVEDMFVRKFMTGTWHGLFVSEIIIKGNIILSE